MFALMQSARICVCALGLLWSLPSFAAPGRPSLTHVAFQPNHIDLSLNREVQVSARWAYFDDRFSQAEVTLLSSTGDAAITIVFRPGDRVSGNGNSGLYQRVVTLPADIGPGQWRLDGLTVWDRYGRAGQFDRQEILAHRYAQLTLSDTATLGDTVVLASQEVKLEKDVRLQSGDIVVNQSGGQLELKQGANTGPDSRLKADLIKLEKQVIIDGDLFFNQLDADNDAIINGEAIQGLALPVFSTLPDFFSMDVGGDDVMVDKNTEVTLAAGAYAELKADKDSTVVLSGGDYSFVKVDLDKNTQLLFAAPTRVFVQDDLKVDKNAFLGPSDPDLGSARDLVIYLDGQADIKQGSIIEANLYARDGDLKFDKDVIARGAFIGNKIEFKKNAVIEFASAFANRAPIATDDFVTVAEGATATLLDSGADSVLGNDIDDAGDVLTASALSAPLNGSLSLQGDGTFEYSHDGSETSDDGFDYEVCDDGQPALCDQAFVAIAITPVNDPPIAADASAQTDEDMAVTITVNASDAEGGSLSFSTLSGPAQGSLGAFVPNGPSSATTLYTPAANFNGSDAFQFQVCDDGNPVECDNATVTIAIVAVNDAPVAQSQTVSVDEDQDLDIVLSASDAEGDTLSFTVTGGPANGTLAGPSSTTPASATFNYSPNADFFGEDNFSFEVCDPDLACDSAQITIQVTAINDPPQTQDAQATTLEDTPVTITLSGTDPEGQPLNFSVVAGPSHGSANIQSSGVQSANLSYQPDTDFFGSDQLTFQACDSGTPVLCASAIVMIEVTPVNDLPVAQNQTVSTLEDQNLTVILAGTDAENDPLTLNILTQPGGDNEPGPGEGEPEPGNPGTLIEFVVIDDFSASIVFVPGELGLVSFTFEVCEAAATTRCDQGIIEVEVIAVNDPPVAQDLTIQARADSITNIDVQAIDEENDALSFAIVDDPARVGTAAITSQSPSGRARISYTPASGFEGPDSVVYSVSDGVNNVLGTISIIVVTPPPVTVTATPAQVELDQDSSTVIPLSGRDSAGNTLAFSIVNPPANGSLGAIDVLDAQSAQVSYTPNAGFFGSDSLDFQVDNGLGGSDVARVSIQVNQVIIDPPPPLAATSQSVSTVAGIELEIVLAGTEPNGDLLTFTVIAGPANGTLSAPQQIDNLSARVTYTPNDDFVGADGITFTVTNPGGQLAFGNVSIAVLERPDAVANDALVAVDANRANPIRLTGSDAPGDVLTFTIITGPAHGTLTGLSQQPPFAAEIVYTPDPGYTGPDAFEFQVDDGQGQSDRAIISLQVENNGRG